MTTDRLDVAVVGGGAMGAAAAWQLGRRGHAVTVHEQFARGHDRGSSHGNARIFRLAYPDPAWVAVAVESFALWRDLQDQAGVTLVDHVGGVDHGAPRHVGAIADALAARGVGHERLHPHEAAQRWPGMRFDGEVVVQPDAGTTDAAGTVAALLDLAEAAGVEVREHAPVASIEVVGDGAIVHPRGGTGQRVDRVVVTAGAWASGLLHDIVATPPLEVTMEQPALFAPRRPVDWPAFIHYGSGLDKVGGLDDPILGYGLPTPDGLVKLGEHHTGRRVDPDDPPDGHDPTRLDRVRRYVSEWFPGLDPDPVRVETCLYTTTPSTDFVVDRVGPVVVGAGFSGHGFKFVPWVGRELADLVEGASGRPGFRLDR